MDLLKDILYGLGRFKVLSITAAVLLVLNVFVYAVGLYPLYASIKKLEDRMITLKSQRIQAQAQKQAQADLLQFQRRLPSQHDLVQIMSSLSKSAEQQGLGAPTLNYTPSRPDAHDLVQTTVDLGVIGSYPQIKQFLYSLEELDQLLIPDEITLATTRDAGKVQAHLSIEVYLHGGQ